MKNDESIMQNEKKKRLGKHIWGYGIIGFTDGAVYDFFVNFGMFFLTTIAHVPSTIAGGLISAGTLINGVMNPIVGYISDRNKSKMGRRRGFIIIGGSGTCIALFMMLMPITDVTAVKFVYFTIMVIGFWITYALFFPPYLALGAEITNSYDGRSTLRSLVTFFNNTGTLAASVLSTSVIALLTGMNLSEHAAWFVATAVLSGLCFICVFAGFKMTAGHDVVLKETERVKIIVFLKAMVMSYINVLKMKSLRRLMFASIFTVIGFTCSVSCMMFLMKFNAGLTAAGIATAYLFMSLLGLVRPAITNFFCNWFQKKGAFVVCTLLYIIPAAYYAVAGVDSMTDIIIIILLEGFMLSGYWQIVPAMIYDLSEVDYYFNKEKREGTLVSLLALAESFAGAIGAAVAGFCLTKFGFVETIQVQAETALNGIIYMNTLIPSAFFIIATILILAFPINRSKHELLVKAVEEGVFAEDNNEKYEELKKIN